jgi:hypothetical protein
VGILNRSSEVVATGKVRLIKGRKRIITIRRKFGEIGSEYKVVLLSEDSMSGERPQYRIYREPAKILYGGAFEYGTVTAGSGAPGYGLTGFGGYRFLKHFLGVGRLLYASYSSQIRDRASDNAANLPYHLTEMGLFGGVAYMVRESQPLSFKGELGVGYVLVDATIDGSTDLADNKFQGQSKVKNGWAPMVRWSLGAAYRINHYRLTVDVVQGLVHQALSSSLAMGATFEWR